MANNGWFDDEMGKDLPLHIHRLPLPQRVEKLPSAESLEEVTLALTILAKERESHPELIFLLEKYPPLLSDYLVLPSREKMALEKFRMHSGSYFVGYDYGDVIRELHDPRRGKYNPAAAKIARKYRWAEQLARMFEFYSAQEEKPLFNNVYLQRNAKLKAKFGTRGATLVKNAYQNNIPVSDIVALVAYVQPEILDYYRPPRYKSNVVLL